MNEILLSKSTEIDVETGFRYRTVYMNSENSCLHYHDYYEVFLVLSSEIKHLINGTELILSRGALTFIRKDDKHYYYPSEKNDISFVNIAFTEEILNELFDYLSTGFCSEELLSAETPPTVYISESDIKRLLRKIEYLNSISRNDILKLSYQLRVLLFKIFTEFFQEYKPSQIADSNEAMPEWLIELDKKMHQLENFSRPANHMLELSGKSRTHLGRTIKKYYGTTIPQYIYDIRLNYLANSLITTDNTVTNICFECGFDNISWAYELFKTKYGTTPYNFRKQNKS